MEGKLKEVNFAKYCLICKNRKVKETEEPCNECLTEPGRVDSKRPRFFDRGGLRSGKSK